MHSRSWIGQHNDRQSEWDRGPLRFAELVLGRGLAHDRLKRTGVCGVLLFGSHFPEARKRGGESVYRSRPPRSIPLAYLRAEVNGTSSILREWPAHNNERTVPDARLHWWRNRSTVLRCTRAGGAK